MEENGRMITKAYIKSVKSFSSFFIRFTTNKEGTVERHLENRRYVEDFRKSKDS